MNRGGSWQSVCRCGHTLKDHYALLVTTPYVVCSQCNCVEYHHSGWKTPAKGKMKMKVAFLVALYLLLWGAGLLILTTLGSSC